MAEDFGMRQNPFKAEYSQLFSWLERKAEQDIELAGVLVQLKSQMRDSVVVDIGAGEGDAMARLALDSKARQYIGVDIRPRRKPALEGATYVTEQIERFLERPLPPGRHTVICNGIDSEATNIDFRKLAHQLRDGLKDPDTIFGFETPSLVLELLKLKSSDGKEQFTVQYQYPELNFFIIRRRPDSI